MPATDAALNRVRKERNALENAHYGGCSSLELVGPGPPLNPLHSASARGSMQRSQHGPSASSVVEGSATRALRKNVHNASVKRRADRLRAHAERPGGPLHAETAAERKLSRYQQRRREQASQRNALLEEQSALRDEAHLLELRIRRARETKQRREERQRRREAAGPDLLSRRQFRTSYEDQMGHAAVQGGRLGETGRPARYKPYGRFSAYGDVLSRNRAAFPKRSGKF